MFTHRELTVIELALENRKRFLEENINVIPNTESKLREVLEVTVKVYNAYKA